MTKIFVIAILHYQFNMYILYTVYTIYYKVRSFIELDFNCIIKTASQMGVLNINLILNVKKFYNMVYVKRNSIRVS